MTAPPSFPEALDTKVREQLRAQRVGYLLGGGSSYLDNAGYPLASELWDLIKGGISDAQMRADIQAKLDAGATGLEHALDLLDEGGAEDPPYRRLVTDAIADLFQERKPPLDLHVDFLRRLSQRPDPSVKVFSLNYDPLVEWAAEAASVRLRDGFLGFEHAYFEPAVFEEHIGRIRGRHRWSRFDRTVKPINLLKLHGSLGWYECPQRGVRRCAFRSKPPPGTKRLMVPPQRRKATDTMYSPYSALWSDFRGCLSHNANPINRLACFGYGFADEHVDTVIEAALARRDFTLLIFTKAMSDKAWRRWSVRTNAIVVTETRCSLQGTVGPGHTDLWRFERLCKEV